MYKINKKAIVFSHNDLDGAGCVILGKLAFNTCAYRVNNYNNIDKKICDFLDNEALKSQNSYDYLFITDISVNDDTINKLNESRYRNSYILLDHHDTRTEIHNGDNIFVIVNDSEGKPNSGTNLFAEFIEHNFGFKFNQSTNFFVDMVRCWDTWLWKEMDIFTPVELNHLFGHLKFIEFVKNFCSKLEDNSFGLFSDREREIIQKIVDDIQYYFDTMKTYISFEDEYTIGYCVAEDYTSYIADMYLDKNKNVDFLIILNLKKGLGSIRTQKENIHVGKIAEKLGGGGHEKASGFSINEELYNSIMSGLNESIMGIIEWSC